MRTLWIMLCNASLARIYAVTRTDHTFNFTLLEERQHPESRLKGTELMTDGPGHYNTRETTRGAFAERTAPKEVEAEHFAHELVSRIHDGWAMKNFQHLIIAAPPHFLGLLRQYLKPHLAHVEPHLKEMVDKDYTAATLNEIKKIFAPYYKKMLTRHAVG